MTGTALGRVLEVMKTSKGEGLLKLWFVDSQDDQYRNWAREAFNERQDFLLHLCAGAAGDCKSKTKSKKIGWAHTRWMEALQLQECTSLESPGAAKGQS